ncbi:MAG: hypothetical protein PWQ18_1014 [Clostridia bacterium]|nr:hypothetical protein [Clostridia bacterium]
MKSTKVFLDSSIIIAGLASETGGSHRVLALAELGLITPYISEEVTEEVMRNIQKKLPESIAHFYTLFKSLPFVFAVADEKAMKYARTLINEKDASILAAAISGKVDWLLSLDKHFQVLDWKGNLEFKIASPQLFLNEFL